MKTKLIISTLTLLAVGSIVLFGAALGRQPKWTDDQARAWVKRKWAEHCKQYGSLSNNVLFMYKIETNWSIAVFEDGSRVELGFRDDGIVVWRTKK